MKKLLVCALFAVSACAAFGAELPQGTHEFKLDVSTDFKDNGEKTVPIMGGVGYFFMNNWETGLWVDFNKNKFDSYWGQGSVWGVGLFTEYNIVSGSFVVPFIGARAGWLTGEKESRNALEAAFGPGVRFFLTQSLSLYLQGEVEVSNREIYNFDRVPTAVEHIDGNGDRTDFVGRAGVRYIF